MADSMSPTTRRHYLGGLVALFGASTTGCVAFDDRSEQSSPERTTGVNDHSTEETDRETTVTKTAMPDLNHTPYPVVQQRTDGSAFPEGTVVLTSEDWRDVVSPSDFTDETIAFVSRTDFSLSYIVGFEAEVTEWGYYLRLEEVDERSDGVHVRFSDAFVEGGPNVEQWHLMFVRLPKRDGVPQGITLDRTDEPK